jgi:hypothetical protein
VVTINQPGGPGKFESPNWDQTSLNKVRDALLVLATTVKDMRGAFGNKGEVDLIRHWLVRIVTPLLDAAARVARYAAR